ncbi:MAG: hypothetical protein WCK15_21065, partial [Pirellula sp.]
TCAMRSSLSPTRPVSRTDREKSPRIAGWISIADAAHNSFGRVTMLACPCKLARVVGGCSRESGMRGVELSMIQRIAIIPTAREKATETTEPRNCFDRQYERVTTMMQDPTTWMKED